MVVAAFPIVKLTVLLIKQISKPIANICKERAKHHPFFRTYVCMPPAQFYNWCEVKSKMWILNLGKPVNIPVLSQESAIELGANLLGETLIFSIGAGLLIFEYSRQSKNEAAKEKKKAEELKHMTDTIAELYFTVQQQQQQLLEIEKIIVKMGGPQPTSPHPSIKTPPAPATEQPPPVTPPSAGTPPPMEGVPPPPPLPAKAKKLIETESPHNSLTPYPNQGLILKSLNYIQMDVFSSIFPCYPEKITQIEDKHETSFKRAPALLSEALHSIENNFRSLF